jgi:hypothetical protein
MLGASHPLGNTEEALIIKNVGLVERGVPGRPFNHTTGAGHVAAVTGCYDDCINVKRNTFLLLISEVFGGVGGQAVRLLTRLAHAARTASDRVYYDHAGREVPFFLYHSRAVSRAAAVGHGEVLRIVIADARTRATRAADDERRHRVGGGGGAALSPSPAALAASLLMSLA